MKRLQKQLLSLCLIIFVLNAVQSQNLIIGGTGNIGLSKVSSNLPISGDYKVKFAPSGNMGLFIEKRML